jgi:hypothetical protein
LCGHKIGVGSYGFGWALPGTGVDAPGKFSLFNQAGAPVADCSAERQADLKLPKPLQVVTAKDGSARLYHGKHYKTGEPHDLVLAVRSRYPFPKREP